MNAPSTNGGRTATVETLTAEVRTLMIGSRQVTMSVAKQIDVVPLANLTPFGRINIGGDSDWVIGAHSETGALCRSDLDVHEPRILRVSFPDDEPERAACCGLRMSRYLTSDRVAYSTNIMDWPMWIPRSSMTELHPRSEPCTDDCAYWYVGSFNDHLQLLVDERRNACETEQRQIDHAKALPLIVLAGLR
ncbi:hypothetical protein [Mycobacteroides abscessus]|uniref:hypothetical protein n=1 Tax=Mycobacteroides abscessus TaxID=36809 RepID=UPI00210715CA|nr:hypothetical protein [Mycobacteroides abscessus]